MDATPSNRKLSLMAALVVFTLLAGAGFVGFRLTSDQDDESEVSAADGSPGESTDPIVALVGPSSQVGESTADVAAHGGGLSDSSASSAPGVRVNAKLESGDVIAVGVAGLTLEEADVDVVLDDQGQLAPGTTGAATFQLPTKGPLEGAMLDRPLRGAVGVALGSELAHLGAHLRDDEHYFYADLGTQPFELFLDLDADEARTAGLPQRISAGGPGSGASMFVSALDGDYFYLSTPCVSMVPGGTDSTRRPSRQRQNDHAGVDASEIPGVSLDLTSFDPGGCGFGWSIAGLVPFVPLMAERGIEFPSDFGAHVVVDGTIPIHPAASLDGELFYRFDGEQVSIWANGEVDVGVKFLKGAAEVSLPAVRGTFGLTISPTTFDLSITGATGSSASDGSPSEVLADLAPIRGRLDLDGELHIAGGEVLETSFIQLSGDLNITPMTLQTDSDVPVEDVLTADAIVRIDHVGLLARGSIQISPVGPLSIKGTAELEFLVPFADISESYLQVRGDLAIGDTGLGGEAELRIDKSGAFARGTVNLASFGGLEVEGWFGPNGFQLTGAAQVILPIGDLDKVAAGLVEDTNNDEVIRLLNSQIDARVNQIAAGDSAKGSELRHTIADMRQAFTDIASVRETIAYNDGIIAQRWRDHQADIDWHWALSDFDRFWDKGPHAIRLAVVLAEIEALKVANSVQYGYIDVANTVVSATQQSVLAIIGWDEQLNALLALQTEAYVSTLRGNFVATVLNGADAILDAFGIDGSAVGTVTFTVGTEGVGATAELEWCRDGSCDTLVGASVTLVPAVEVCATILGAPACVTL